MSTTTAKAKVNPIYLVIDTDSGAEHLVESPTASQAVRHVVRGRYTTTPASGHVIARLVAKGITVEKVGKDEPAAP